MTDNLAALLILGILALVLSVAAVGLTCASVQLYRDVKRAIKGRNL